MMAPQAAKPFKASGSSAQRRVTANPGLPAPRGRLSSAAATARSSATKSRISQETGAIMKPLPPRPRVPLKNPAEHWKPTPYVFTFTYYFPISLNASHDLTNWTSNPTQQVTFNVGKGEAQEPFVIHKEVACHYSPVLNACFNSEFIEGQKQTYNVDDIDKNAFRLFMQWLYTQNIKLSAHSNIFSDFSKTRFQPHDCDATTRQSQEFALVQLWVLAEKYMIPTLQNYTIRILYRLGFVCKPLSPEVYLYIYDNTDPQSKLRLLASHQAALNPNDRVFLANPSLYPHEMLIDLLIKVQQDRRDKLELGLENLEEEQSYLVDETVQDFTREDRVGQSLPGLPVAASSLSNPPETVTADTLPFTAC
jgi:hypothetical protein